MENSNYESIHSAFREKYNELTELNEQEHLFETEEELDSQAVSDLFDEGAPLNSAEGMGVFDALARHYQFNRKSGAASEEQTRAYVKKIKEQLNKKRKRAKLRNVERCEKSLNRLINLSKNKFKNYLKTHPMGAYRKGAIVLALVMAGYPTETIAQALLKNNLVSFGPREEIDKMIAQSGEVVSRYEQINNPAEKTTAMGINTPGDFYRYYSRDYIKETNTRQLNYRDDLHIASGMYSHLVDFYKEENRIRDNNNPLLKNYIEGQIKPKILESIKEGSPVAREYGRDINEYAKSLVEEAEIVSKKAIELSGPADANVQQILNGVRAKYAWERRQAEEKLRLLNEDALVAKEMLGLSLPEEKIREELRQNSQSVKQKEMDETSLTQYLNSVLQNAKEAMRKEEDIHFFEKKSIEGKDLAMLTVAGVTVGMLYQQNMLEFANSTLVNHFNLCNESTDYNIACKLLNEFPDLDKEKLSASITELSPRRALLGADENYGQGVVERASLDIEQAKYAYTRQLSLKEEFERTQGFIREGVYNDQDPILANQYGKIAMRSLQRNYPPEIFQRAMLTKAQEDYAAGNELGMSPELFVKGIIAQANDVLARNKVIQDHVPDKYPDMLTPEGQIRENYMEMAQHQLSKKSFVDRATDICFARAMLKQDYPEESISQVLSEYSPVYAEPGHTTDGYLRDVLEHGKDSLAQSRENFMSEIILPRDDFTSVQDEFKYQQKRIMDRYDLPYTPAIDEKIANGLLRNGIDGDLLAPAIQEYSPLARENPQYGVNLLERMIASGMPLDQKTSLSAAQDLTRDDPEPPPPSHSTGEKKVKSVEVHEHKQVKKAPDQSLALVRTITRTTTFDNSDNDGF